LARLTGLPRTTVNALERQRAFLCAPYALLLTEALRCKLDDLYVCVEEPTEPAVSTIPGLLEKLRAAQAALTPCPTCGRLPR